MTSTALQSLVLVLLVLLVLLPHHPSLLRPSKMTDPLTSSEFEARKAELAGDIGDVRPLQSEKSFLPFLSFMSRGWDIFHTHCWLDVWSVYLVRHRIDSLWRDARPTDYEVTNFSHSVPRDSASTTQQPEPQSRKHFSGMLISNVAQG